MWQIYGFIALDLIKRRRREAEAERQASDAGKLAPHWEAEPRFATIRQMLSNTHRA